MQILSLFFSLIPGGTAEFLKASVGTWLDLSLVPTPEVTEVDVLLKGGVTNKLSPYSEL